MEFVVMDPRAVEASDTLVAMGAISGNGAIFLRHAAQRLHQERITFLEKDVSAEFNSTSELALLRSIHSFIEPEVLRVFNSLFSDISYEVGKQLSNRDREESNQAAKQSLLYGEIEFESFYKLLKKFRPTKGGLFYDLGSGTGKAVVIARLMCDFDHCIGIELLESLHEKACTVWDMYNNQCRSDFGDLSFCKASILDYDWSDGEMVFANSTNFDPELMRLLSEKATELKPGSIFITFTKPLSNPHFELLEEMRSKMSWGRATIYIQRRRDEDGNATVAISDSEESAGAFRGRGKRLLTFPEDTFVYTQKDAKILCQYLLHRRNEKRRQKESQGVKETNTNKKESENSEKEEGAR